MNLIPKEVLKNCKHLHGFLPIYKPSGICCMRLKEVARLDLYFVLEHNDTKLGRWFVQPATYLEPFASGLVTLLIGHGISKKKNFKIADYAYNCVVEFGVERHLNCIDGRIISRRTTNDLSLSRVEEVIETFIGEIHQKRLKSYRFDPVNHNTGHLSDGGRPPYVVENSKVLEYYNQIILPPAKSSKSPRQKYPMVHVEHATTVHKICLKNFDKSFLELEILCQGSFSVRQFVSDLAEKLGTKASLVNLIRQQEGPMLLGDPRVLRLHEVHVEGYLQLMPSLNEFYQDFHEHLDKQWDSHEISKRLQYAII